MTTPRRPRTRPKLKSREQLDHEVKYWARKYLDTDMKYQRIHDALVELLADDFAPKERD